MCGSTEYVRFLPILAPKQCPLSTHAATSVASAFDSEQTRPVAYTSLKNSAVSGAEEHAAAAPAAV